MVYVLWTASRERALSMPVWHAVEQSADVSALCGISVPASLTTGMLCRFGYIPDGGTLCPTCRELELEQMIAAVPAFTATSPVVGTWS